MYFIRYLKIESDSFFFNMKNMSLKQENKSKTKSQSPKLRFLIRGYTKKHFSLLNDNLFTHT